MYVSCLCILLIRVSRLHLASRGAARQRPGHGPRRDLGISIYYISSMYIYIYIVIVIVIVIGIGIGIGIGIVIVIVIVIIYSLQGGAVGGGCSGWG